MVTRLENTVRALRGDGHEVLVIAPTIGTDIPGVHERGTRTIELPFLYRGREWALPDRLVTRGLREFCPDVVHVVNPVLMGAVAARHASGRYPLVVSYHTDVATYAANYHLGWIRSLLHRVMRATYHRADVRLATSPVGRAHLRELGVDGVQLWARGVDRQRFRPDRDGSGMRPRLATDPSLPLVLYVGRLAAEKGCDQLIGVATAEPRLQLALVGDGPDRARLERLFRGSRVTFTGFLRGEELADAYAAADVFVFPSRTDTLGLVLLEAMATGLPVVAYDTPAARETLDAYPRAVLLPVDSPPAAWNAAVAGLLQRRDEQALPSRAAASAAADDWHTATEALTTAYEQARASCTARDQPSRRRRFGRFAAVGALNAAVDLAAFNIMVFAHPTRSSKTVVAYNTIAVLIALLNSYAWNSRWTFRDRNRAGALGRWRQRGLFLLQGLINLAVNDVTILGLSLVLSPILGMPATLASNVSKVVAMITASSTSYVLMHYVVFRRARAPDPRVEQAEEEFARTEVL